MADVSVERTIEASPEEVWTLASDPTRMGEWSPENTGATWIGGATGPAVGAKFKGSNQNGRFKWSTTCTVTHCTELEQFEFDVKYGPLPIAHWGFLLEPSNGATKVTEHWTNHEARPIAVIVDKTLGVADRGELNRTNMEATLAAMAAELEG
ncbi:MAG TPA: SRPBCC family protein [Acidimicrobiales bacterium]|nr:SRPBCC family protein [Acidimicrobiales bacterium]